MKIYAATADALQKWEPRFSLQQVLASSAALGSVTLDLTGVYLPDGSQVNISGIKVQ
jgi:phage baseplate assembly protein W